MTTLVARTCGLYDDEFNRRRSPVAGVLLSIGEHGRSAPDESLHRLIRAANFIQLSQSVGKFIFLVRRHDCTDGHDELFECWTPQSVNEGGGDFCELHAEEVDRVGGNRLGEVAKLRLMLQDFARIGHIGFKQPGHQHRWILKHGVTDEPQLVRVRLLAQLGQLRLLHECVPLLSSAQIWLADEDPHRGMLDLKIKSGGWDTAAQARIEVSLKHRRVQH